MVRVCNRVLIDDQIFRKQRVGGISSYFLSLLKEFQSNSEIKVKLGVILYKTEKLSQFPGRNMGRYNSRAYVIPALILNGLKMLSVRYELIHSTFYSRWSFALLSRKIHIVTIHDMIPEDFPDFFDQGNPNKYKGKYIQDANGIIAVSQYTYERLIHHYPGITCPIAVIPLASRFELQRTDIVDHKSKFKEKTILFVGPRVGHKNFEALVKSLSKLTHLIPEISLICAGGGSFSNIEIQQFTSVGVDKHIRQIDCNDEGLKDLYLKCSLYVCPSIAEGFGLPSVEAASLCTPIIVGKNSYLGGKLPDNLVLVCADDIDEMTRKIYIVLSNFDAYEISAISSYNSVRDLSWSNTSDKTAQFYLSTQRESRPQRSIRCFTSWKKDN
jgi:glycosyltransferase involved in cell wall biosynthesis